MFNFPDDMKKHVSFATCNFVQATNKMKTIRAKHRPSVGKENPLKRDIILKDHHGRGIIDENIRDGITIQALGYKVDDHTEGLFHEGIVTPFEVD